MFLCPQAAMRLLIVTQVVDQDNPVLGFFHRWIEEFAKHAEQVEVICLQKGKYTLPDNVQVHSLGKENGVPYLARVTYALRFLWFVWKLRKNYDSVFVHMNPEYVATAGWFWRIYGKRIGLWYTHKSVNLKLRIAEIFAHTIFTASKESFRLSSNKVHVYGHGIGAVNGRTPTGGSNDPLRLITIGRITASKNIVLQLQAAALLPPQMNWNMNIVGGPVTDADAEYEKELLGMVQKLGISSHVSFKGPLSHEEALQTLSGADVFLHTSETGSLDKAVLEALAVGLAVVSTSSILSEVAFIYRSEQTPEALAAAIERATKAPVAADLQKAYVEENHGLAALISRIVRDDTISSYGHS